jgi:hypothetical protein
MFARSDLTRGEAVERLRAHDGGRYGTCRLLRLPVAAETGERKGGERRETVRSKHA